MKMATRFVSCASAVAALSLFGVPDVGAQESSYTPGTVWEFSQIQTEPGQTERYIDWLAGNWKKIQEYGKKEGYVVSYHVFTVNNPRAGEPDMVLAIEYKDYLTNAQRLAVQKKIEAMMSMDTRKMDAASGERKSMRKIMGGVELQELVLK